MTLSSHDGIMVMSPSQIMTHVTTFTEAKKLKILRQNRGLLQRVAEALLVDPSAVSRVFWNKSVSERITAALDDELISLGVIVPEATVASKI